VRDELSKKTTVNHLETGIDVVATNTILFINHLASTVLAVSICLESAKQHTLYYTWC